MIVGVRRAVPAVAALALVAGIGTTVFTVNTHRDDLELEAARSRVASAASDGAVAVLSYRSDTVDADVEHAKSFLTGDFSTYYSTFGTDVVAPAAKDRGITSSVTVSGTSVVSSTTDSAVALVFVNQSVTSSESPTPTVGSNSLRIELTRVNDEWLVSKLDPV